jgi:hypothetical protein
MRMLEDLRFPCGMERELCKWSRQREMSFEIVRRCWSDRGVRFLSSSSVDNPQVIFHCVFAGKKCDLRENTHTCNAHFLFYM